MIRPRIQLEGKNLVAPKRGRNHSREKCKRLWNVVPRSGSDSVVRKRKKTHHGGRVLPNERRHNLILVLPGVEHTLNMFKQEGVVSSTLGVGTERWVLRSSYVPCTRYTVSAPYLGEKVERTKLSRSLRCWVLLKRETKGIARAVPRSS